MRRAKSSWKIADPFRKVWPLVSTVPAPEPGRGPSAYHPALLRSDGLPSGSRTVASGSGGWSRPIRSKRAATASAGKAGRLSSPPPHDLRDCPLDRAAAVSDEATVECPGACAVTRAGAPDVHG